MKTSLAINIVLGVLLVVSAGINVYQNQALREANADLVAAVDAQSEALDAAADTDSRISELEAELDRVRGERNDAQVELAALQPEEEEVAAENASEAKPKGTNEQMGKLLGNPAILEMVRSQKIGEIQHKYGDLFAKLALDPDTESAVFDLLLEREMAQLAGVQKIMTGEVSGEARTEHSLAMDEERKAFNKQIREMLGPEAAEEYVYYNKTEGERMMVGFAEQALAGTPDAFTPEQADALVDAIYLANEEFPHRHDPTDQSMAFADGVFTDQLMSEIMEDVDGAHDHIFNSVSYDLTPAQQEALRGSMTEMRSLSELSLKQARQYLGGGDEGQSGN